MKKSRLFIIFSGILLLTTGLAKLVSAFGSAPILYSVSPILPLSFRTLMLFAGVIEVSIGLYCTICSSKTEAILMIAWISTVFAIYRFSLWAIDWKLPCPCLGSLTGALHISPELSDNIIKVVLSGLLAGSYTIIASRYLERKTFQRTAMPTIQP